MVDYETIRKETHDYVVSRPFTSVPGLPTWEQGQKFLKECKELAMAMDVTYDWAGDHGLLAEIYGCQKYFQLTGKRCVPPARPPVVHPDILANNLNQNNARIAEAENAQARVNYAVLDGFRSGFGKNFRKAFDKKYYEQLCEDTFCYKMILPLDYIKHLQMRWIKIDTLVIKRLKNYYLQGWDEEEHIISFEVRLEKERKKLGELTPPITIMDKELTQHYVEEMLKRADYFGQKCCTEFKELPAIQKERPAAATHYEKRNKELEDYEQLGGQCNPYASTNAATEMQNSIQTAVATCMASMRDENAQALTRREEGMQEQINKLTSAIALIAKEQSKFMKADANKEDTPPRCKKRRYSTDSSDNSSSDDEPTPPPRPRKRKKTGKKEKKLEYKEGDKFKIGMEFADSWPYKKDNSS